MFCHLIFLHSMWQHGESFPQFPSGSVQCSALADPTWASSTLISRQIVLCAEIMVMSRFWSSTESSDNSCNSSHMMPKSFTNACEDMRIASPLYVCIVTLSRDGSSNAEPDLLLPRYRPPAPAWRATWPAAAAAPSTCPGLVSCRWRYLAVEALVF